MSDSKIKIYPYRWVVLIAFMLINIMVQILWIYYAPVATIASGVFHVDKTGVDMLANLFLLIYLPVAIPAAWAIDTFGFKKAVGFGAIMIALFGLLRAVFPNDYNAAVVGTIGIAIGQPFLMGAFTKLAALWFPKEHRATVTGIMFLAVFVGIGLGEVLTPSLVTAHGFNGMQMIYGITTLITVLIFLVFAKEQPPTPASAPGDMVRALVLDGLKKILKMKDVYILALALFIGSGIVNSVFTLIDGISIEKSLTTGQGVTLTAILLFGGIVGSIIMPAVSDALQRRKSIMVAGIFLALPTVLLMVFSHAYVIELISFFMLGFLITGLTPLAYQYGAEITHPAPEGTSNGVFALVVQASGFILLLMDVLKKTFHGSYMPSFIGLGVLFAISGFLLIFNRESPEMNRKTGGE